MDSPNLAKFTEITADEFFKNEEQFSDWLNQHLSEIGEVLGLTLEEGRREVPTGRYSTDIVARDGDSDTGDDVVIIENQIKQTNHDHLGKLITYASGHDAKTIIWISPEFTDEHIEALQWLNAYSSDKISFFGIKLQLIKIENSPVSPVFTPVVQPPFWGKRIKSTDQIGTVQKARLKIQQYIIDEIDKILPGKFNARAKPKIGLMLGHIGKNFDLYFKHHTMYDRVIVGVRIRKLDRTPEQINKFFEELKKHQEDIERELGEKLEWVIPVPESKQTRYWILSPTELDEEPLENFSDEDLIKLATLMANKAKQFTEVFPKYEKMK